MGRLEGKRIVVTGSSRGLGRAFAIACAAEGASVVINGTNAIALEEVETTINEQGGNVIPVLGSVADEPVCESLVSTCVQRYGGIDVMVNNAGIVRDRTIMKMTVEEWDEVMAVNLRGTFLCTKHAALAMRDADPQGGHIIQISSVAAFAGGGGQGNYAASKAGMMGMLKSCLAEFSRYDIRINAVCPQAESDMTQFVLDRIVTQAKQQGREAPRPVDLGFGTSEEVAQAIVFLASAAASHLNGQCMTFTGRKVAMWKYASELNSAERDHPWTADDLAGYYQDK